MASSKFSEEDETKNINALMILEVLGKPPAHLVETLEKMVEQINGEKGVSVLSKKIHEPKPMKDNETLFTSFAEVEVNCEEVLQLAVLLFKYMPAHVDIVHPEFIALSNAGWAEIFNALVQRLHNYDEVARIITTQKNQLEKELKALKSQKT